MPTLPSVTFYELFNRQPGDLFHPQPSEHGAVRLSPRAATTHHLASIASANACDASALLLGRTPGKLSPRRFTESPPPRHVYNGTETQDLPAANQFSDQSQKNPATAGDSPALETHTTEEVPDSKEEKHNTSVRPSDPADDDVQAMLLKAEGNTNAVVSQFGVRGKQGRRLTFVMREVPDVLIKGGDRFIQEAQSICGTDVATEDETSDCEDWGPSSIENDFPEIPMSAATSKDFDESLTAELLAANEETDTLYRLDSLAESAGDMPGGIGTNCTEHQDGGYGAPSLGSDGSATQTREAGTDMNRMLHPDSAPVPANTSTMDVLQLRLWFFRVRNSYQKSVKVVIVSAQGKKYARKIRIDEKYLYLSRPGHSDRRCHLACVKNIKLGFSSPAFHTLLDITPENCPVPPHQSCAEIVLPSNSVSMIFPSEHARNEFLLLLRVVVRQAKRHYGDNSNLTLLQAREGDPGNKVPNSE